MSSMIDYTTAPSSIVVTDIGKKIEGIRLSRNIRQEDLANMSGVSKRTIFRLEKGENSTLETLIRVMQALGLASNLEVLLPNPEVRPIERVKYKGKDRQRAHVKPEPESPEPFHWGDKADQQGEANAR